MGYADETLQQWVSSVDALDATGDAADTFKVTVPITVVAVGVIATVACTGTNAVVKFDKRPTAGSDTGRGDGDVGVVTLPDPVAGAVTKNNITPQDFDPGDEIVPQVTTAATAGDGCHFIHYRQRHEVDGNLTDVTIVTA